MKIYEGTDGLRGLITKLIEVWDFKKIVTHRLNTTSFVLSVAPSPS